MPTHRERGSESMSTALKNRVSGTARIAPSGPMTADQNIRDRNVTVVFSPTASPVIFGWITAWATKLITENQTMTHSAVAGPPSSRPSSAGGITPMTKPMLGM